jgi:hypothetical protein
MKLVSLCLLLTSITFTFNKYTWNEIDVGKYSLPCISSPEKSFRGYEIKVKKTKENTNLKYAIFYNMIYDQNRKIIP